MKSFKTLYFIFLSSRPVNLVLTGLSVILGYWFASGQFWGTFASEVLLSAVLICAGGNLLNDFYDIEIDKVNRPDRPYAAGKLDTFDVVVGAAIASGAGIYISWKIGIWNFEIALLTALMLMIYNRFAKSIALLGNAIVALLAGIVFLYGALAGGNIISGAVPAIYAFLFHLGREILKDIEDIEGDRKSSLSTLPIKFGEKLSRNVAMSIFCILMFMTPFPYLYLEYSLNYLITVLLLVNGGIIVLFLRYLKNLELISSTNVYLKYLMFAGLISLLLR